MSEAAVQCLPRKAANHSNLMPLQNALAREATSSCNPETFGFSSALPRPDVVIRTFSFLRPWSAGLLLTLIQLVVAVFLLAPDGPLSYRYTSLVQHDGYWFANIVDRGYQTIVPPINHKVMEVSNVAFFPGADRFYLLEQLRKSGREDFGRTPRNRDVGDANRRHSVRCISSRARCF